MAYGQRRRPVAVLTFAAYGMSWLWVLTILTLLRLWLAPKLIGGHLPPLSVTFSLLERFPELNAALAANAGLRAVSALLFAPILEEVLFRALPILLVLAFARDEKREEALKIVVIGVCCVIFGVAHGSWFNVPIQGAVGLALGWLFLQNTSRPLVAYASCVLVHAAYNYTVLLT